MTVIFQQNSRQYQPTEGIFNAPNPLTATTDRIRVALTRESWPEGLIAEMAIEYSLDGGTTWAGSMSPIMGGEILGRDGVTPITENVQSCSVPNVGQAGRLARARVNLFQAIRTAITVQALP